MTLSFGLTLGDAGLLYATLVSDNSTNVTGWVCDDSFYEEEAMAVCNSMSGGSYYFFGGNQYVTDQFDDFLVDDFDCNGTEDFSSQCTWIYDHNCYSKEAVFLDCGGPRDWYPGPKSFGLTEGNHGLLYTTTYNYTGQEETGWVCDDMFAETEGEAICTYLFGVDTYWTYAHQQTLDVGIYDDFELDDFSCEGVQDIWSQCTWTLEHNCWYGEGLYLDCGGARAPPDAPNTENGQNSEAFGLTNGTTGILYMRNGWVCDDLFSDDNARVICSEMGMSVNTDVSWWTTDTTVTSSQWNGYFGPNEFGMDNLECSSSADKISDCTWLDTHNCMYTEGVWLDCTGPSASPSSSSYSLNAEGVAAIISVVLVFGVLCIVCFWWFIMRRGQIAGTSEYYRKFDKEDSRMDNLMQLTTGETNQKVGELGERTESDVELRPIENSQGESPMLRVVEPSTAFTKGELQLENERLKAELTKYKTVVNKQKEGKSPPPAYAQADEPLTEKL